MFKECNCRLRCQHHWKDDYECSLNNMWRSQHGDDHLNISAYLHQVLKGFSYSFRIILILKILGEIILLIDFFPEIWRLHLRIFSESVVEYFKIHFQVSMWRKFAKISKFTLPPFLSPRPFLPCDSLLLSLLWSIPYAFLGCCYQLGLI